MKIMNPQTKQYTSKTNENDKYSINNKNEPEHRTDAYWVGGSSKATRFPA